MINADSATAAAEAAAAGDEAAEEDAAAAPASLTDAPIHVTLLTPNFWLIFVAFFAVVNFLLDVLLIPFIGLNAILLSLVAVLSLFLYTEGMILLITNRLRRDVVSSRLDTW